MKKKMLKNKDVFYFKKSPSKIVKIVGILTFINRLQFMPNWIDHNTVGS